MAYLTAQQLTDRVGIDDVTAVADRDGDGVIDADALDLALTDASAEIDSYIGARYPLPLASVPEVVLAVTADIAMYKVSANRTTEEVEKRYKRAVDWLRDVARGVATLGEHPAETAAGAAFSAETRQHTRTKLSGGF